MRYTERDRRELINKLKHVRDPRERDRIIWTIAGQEEAAHRNVASTGGPPRRWMGRKLPESSPSGKTPAPQNIPQIVTDAKRLFGFIIPGFLMLIGLANIVQALLLFFTSGQIETEMPRLITGGIFLMIGLVGIFKAKQGAQGRGVPKQDDIRPEKKIFSR